MDKKSPFVIAAGNSWTTPADIGVIRSTGPAGSAAAARAALEEAIDLRRGMLIFLDPNRAIGYTNPPVEIVGCGGRLTIRALNDRGRVILPPLRDAVAAELELDADSGTQVSGQVTAPPELFAEEHRTRHAGVFRAIRAIVSGMATADDALFGLFGAFGYDLIFQLDPIELHQARRPADRDLVLHLPDEIIDLDFRRDQAVRHRYEFVVGGDSTASRERGTRAIEYTAGTATASRDHRPGEYAGLVTRAHDSFRSGDLFEVVPSQSFRRACALRPAELFRGLRDKDPSPHNLLMNLGDGEFLVGASPEMFVRVHPAGERLVVQTAPISGTIARGQDALQDAARVRELLNSAKDESELTMCTDVDRNDKARVCEAGTVRVTARRKIEMYSALIHTVDHVQGVLREDCDALDAFLAHLWAVTVTGAPKLSAIEFIERNERSPRRWYGGSVGRLGFDGTLDSVLTIRTVQIRDGVATVRAGATLLHDSAPAAEEAETELKAKAMLQVLDGQGRPAGDRAAGDSTCGAGLTILLIDHRDSFVHCLGDYFRQTGAELFTYRSGRHVPVMERMRPDLVVLSPGPGRPTDFGLSATIAAAERLGIPVFGVCLGLQGLVEHFGGSLRVLGQPMHGKRSRVTVTDDASRLLHGLPREFEVGRYHSLHADVCSMPDQLRVVATTDDGVIMAVEHVSRPLAAVQFHPESIMTAQGQIGQRIVRNVVTRIAR